MILNENLRADGRGLKDVRHIEIETNILPSVHSSCLFTRGQTQALIALTLGDGKDAQSYDLLTTKDTLYENFMVHYNFPGFSVGEASMLRAPGRRELGHGNLAKRALSPSFSLSKSETIRLVSEILESNGSSSMATVCGGSLALKAAGVDVKKLIAGVAMGLVVEDDRYAILTDIMGLEDHDGDMDFKIAGSCDGITALQMDIKLGGVDQTILKEAIAQASEAKDHILSIMEKASSEIVLNSNALPSIESFSLKLKELAYYKQRLSEYENALESYDSFLKLNAPMMKKLYNSELTMLLEMLYTNKIALRRSLIPLTQDVIEYINQAQKQSLFIEKIVKLKELKENYELKTRTNIEHLSGDFTMMYERLRVGSRLTKEIITTPSFAPMIQKISKKAKIKSRKADEILFSATTKEQEFINVSQIHLAFSNSQSSLMEFLLSYNKLKSKTIEELSELYCKMVLMYEDEYRRDSQYFEYKSQKFLKVYYADKFR
jgi:ribonuclease PH